MHIISYLIILITETFHIFHCAILVFGKEKKNIVKKNDFLCLHLGRKIYIYKPNIIKIN